jgi:hypothetical protein
MLARPLFLVAFLAAAGGLASGCRDEPQAPPAPALKPLALVPPLHDAQVGEMIRIQPDRGVDAEVYRVVETDDFSVTVERTRYHSDQPEAPVRMTWHRNSFGMPQDTVIRSIDVDRIEVGGRWYDCFRLTVHSKVRTLAFWVSEEVPVHGVLKAAIVQKGEAAEMHAAKLVEMSFDGQ